MAMEKRGDAKYIRLPLDLEAKIASRARKMGRTFNQQLVVDLFLAEHVQDFTLENQLNGNFFELEGKNCKER